MAMSIFDEDVGQPDPQYPQQDPSAGLVASYYDANGNRIESPEMVDAAEAERRRQLFISITQAEYDRNNPGGGGGGDLGDGPPPPAGRPNYGPVPVFDAPVWEDVPEFNWTEQWKQPTFAEAYDDPGYQFGAQEGSRAIQQAAAAKGALNTGGAFKDLYKWGQGYANQQYGSVFDRALTGYNTRFGTAKDIWANKYGSSRDQFDRRYTSAKDMYDPRLIGWQTNANGANLGFQQDWYNYWKDTISGNDLFQAGLNL